MITELKPNTKYKLIDKEGYFATNDENRGIYEDTFVDDIVEVSYVEDHTADEVYGYDNSHNCVISLKSEGKFFRTLLVRPAPRFITEDVDGMCAFTDPFMQLKREKDLQESLYPLTSLRRLHGINLRDHLNTLSATRQELSTQEEGDCMDDGVEEPVAHESGYTSEEWAAKHTTHSAFLNRLSEDTQEYINTTDNNILIDPSKDNEWQEETPVAGAGVKVKGNTVTLKRESPLLREYIDSAKASLREAERVTAHEYLEAIDKFLPDDTPSSDDPTQWTDKHYDFIYTHNLTQEDIEAGEVKIKVDPYLVCKIWGINSVEETGAGFHCLKTLSRMANQKNDIKREMLAMYKQSKRMCEVWGVDVG